MGAHRRRGQGDARGLLQEDRARPPPHRRSPTRPAIEVDLEQAMIEKEPITVILSEKGWIRAMKGHLDDLSKLEFKQGDALMRAVKALDHRQAPAARHQRQGVHAGGRPAARRPRPRRAGAADGRPRGEPRLRRDLRARAGPQAAGRRHLRPRLHRAGGRDGRHDPQGQAGAERRRAGGGLLLRAGRRRHGRRHRREPQDAGLPARRAARDGARQGRAPAALQGRRPVGRARVQEGRGPDLARSRRPHLHAADVGAAATGSASAPRPAGWRRGASRSPTSSGPPF